MRRADLLLVVPFGQPDSHTVHRLLRHACQQAGLRALRGDDLFTPTDIPIDLATRRVIVHGGV